MEHNFCPYCMAPTEEAKPCQACGLTQGSYIPASHHLPPGTVLKERYLVGRVLGEGGFGITYIGRDLHLELKVAIKEFFPTSNVSRVSQASLDVVSYTSAARADYEKGLDRFLQEARAIARMDKQPVIVNVRDYFEANCTAYIVMEYVDGTTFRELAEQRGGCIPAGELLPLIEPLFFALQEMHDHGLIHRDISPDNLMVERGEVRLLDFGCARESDSGSTLTVALKHGYAPVEQYQSKGQGPWTDVYALAATIYDCLTGRKPPQAVDRFVEDELAPPRKLGIELPQRQEQALMRGMSLPPKRRFQSMEEFHAALYRDFPPAPAGAFDAEEAAVPGGEAAEAEQSGPGAPSGPPAGRKRVRLLAGGIAGALVLTVLLAAALPSAPAKDPAPSQTVESASVPDGSSPPAQVSGADPEADWEALFMETVEWLRLDNAEVDRDELRSRLDTLPVDQLFADAVHVTTAGELRQAMDSGGRPVVIDGDIDASAESEGLGIVAPVLISEGVTVITPWRSCGRYENLPQGGSACWAVDGSILVNRGTLRGDIQMGDWDSDGVMDTNVVLNYGTLYADLSAGHDNDSCNVVVNLSEIGIPCAQYRQTSFYNLGTLFHGAAAPEGETVMSLTPQGGDYFIDFIKGFFYNAGEIVLEGQSSEKRGRLDVASNSRFANYGAIRMGRCGEVNNHAILLNYGEITATDGTGRVSNTGWIWNTGTDCVLDTAHCVSTGVVQAGPETSVNLSAVRDGGGGAVLPFGWHEKMDRQAGFRFVSNKEEFYAALEDNNCAWVILYNGVALTLTEDLLLTKSLAIPDGSSLTVEGASLTVADCYLAVDGPIDLRGSVLTVRDEAVAVINDLKDCGGVTLRNDGYLLCRYGLALNDGAVIRLSQARYLLSTGPMELSGVQVNLENGMLRGTGGIRLNGCTVDIAEDGNFLTDGCGVYLNKDTVITNYGCLDTNGWDDQEFACRLTSYGQLGTNDRMTISGVLENHGYFRVWTGPESRIRVSGSLENHGTVELSNGGQFQLWAAGTVTGVPEEYVAN